nr:uncharacterized protein LOC122600493 isoform X2 [Erigeron canadensis]
MKSGVKILLPPFQSLDALRGSSSVSKCAVDNCLSAEETVGRFDGKLSDHDEIIANRMLNKSTLASSEKMVKNCKFIMKLKSGVRPVEEVTQNNVVVPEITVAAKVCPVCKTFSSSSNTTLNAHIDRCLSEESSMKWTANSPKVTVKHKVKPRKLRLMVDIYKTARHCTIEELDKRNDASQATDSSFPDQEFGEFQAAEEEEEKKKEEPQEPTFIHEIDDHDGAVYVDTNGTKVRILSMPKVSDVHDLEARKFRKGGKASKLVIKKNKKKAYGKKNHQKLLKLIPISKKLRKKIADKPASSGQEGDIVVNEGCSKADRGEKPIAHKQIDDLAITRPPWACSKRTAGLAKKRFPVLTKPEDKGSGLGDTSEKTVVIKLKESKSSSLQQNLKSASQEHDTGSEYNLKRKFSAIKISRENCLSLDDDVSGPSQDSSKKSRMERDTNEKSSFETENDMEFTGSNGDYSSGGIEITSESAKTDDQVPFQSDGTVGSFMGLRNSNDDDFLKLVSQKNNTFDSQDGMVDKEGSYFEGVDPIPIPGPPGSFLPLSPGADDDMVSEEELQGNSSLTTMSRVQSSEDPQLHHDVMKKDQFISDSPISTVSSPHFARCASVRFHDTRAEDTQVMADVVNKKSVNASDSRSMDAPFTEKSQTPSDYQPCCCMRKEGVLSKTIPSSYDQESREQVLDPNRRLNNSINDFRCGLFSLTLSPPETLKSPADALKLPVYRDCESVCSPTTPVLRLMGKNLTVVNTDDDQFGPPPGSTTHQQLHNIKTEAFFNFRENQNMSSMAQYSNLHPPNSSRSLVDSRPIHVLDTMFPTTKNGLMAPENYPRLDTRNAAKEIIVVDDSSETKADDHMFKEQRMRRSNNGSSTSCFLPLLGKSYSFANTYNGGVFRDIVNNGNHGKWVSTETGSPLPSINRVISSSSYYPRSFSLPRTQREGGL